MCTVKELFVFSLVTVAKFIETLFVDDARDARLIRKIVSLSQKKKEKKNQQNKTVNRGDAAEAEEVFLVPDPEVSVDQEYCKYWKKKLRTVCQSTLRFLHRLNEKNTQ